MILTFVTKGFINKEHGHNKLSILKKKKQTLNKYLISTELLLLDQISKKKKIINLLLFSPFFLIVCLKNLSFIFAWFVFLLSNFQLKTELRYLIIPFRSYERTIDISIRFPIDLSWRGFGLWFKINCYCSFFSQLDVFVNIFKKTFKCVDLYSVNTDAKFVLLSVIFLFCLFMKSF